MLKLLLQLFTQLPNSGKMVLVFYVCVVVWAAKSAINVYHMQKTIYCMCHMACCCCVNNFGAYVISLIGEYLYKSIDKPLKVVYKITYF